MLENEHAIASPAMNKIHMGNENLSDDLELKLLITLVQRKLAC